MAPFGSLLAGALAHVMGAQHTVILSGAACMMGAAWFALRLHRIRPEMREIYQRLGIVPVAGIADEEAAEK
jgi:positive regulator of sigma E activity